MEFITKDNHKIYLNCPGPHFCDGYMLMESFSEYRTNILVVVDPNGQWSSIYTEYWLSKKMLTFQFSITVNSKYIITITDNKKTKSPITANKE